MKCPDCKLKLSVQNVYPNNSQEIYRNRKCKKCGRAFRTVERMADGTKEFDLAYSAAVKRRNIGWRMK